MEIKPLPAPYPAPSCPLLVVTSPTETTLLTFMQHVLVLSKLGFKVEAHMLKFLTLFIYKNY